jgi:hypothetical protein
MENAVGTTNYPNPNLNIELLLEVKKHILEEPARLIMGGYVRRGFAGEPIMDCGFAFNLPSCGTAGCIAGWSVLLSPEEERAKFEGSDARVARALLRISDRHQDDWLFYVGDWREEDQVRFENAILLKERAQVVANVIDYYILQETGVIVEN